MHKYSENCQICNIVGDFSAKTSSNMSIGEAKRKVEELLKNPELLKQVGDALKSASLNKEAAISPLIRTFVLALMTLAPSIFAVPSIQSDLEMKLKHGDNITMEQVNTMEDRAKKEMQTMTETSVNKVNDAIKDDKGKEKQVDFGIQVGKEKLMAANAYEANILKNMAQLHKILFAQMKSGIMDQASYDKACQILISSFNKAIAGQAQEVVL
jgi:hypothetical protein